MIEVELWTDGDPKRGEGSWIDGSSAFVASVFIPPFANGWFPVAITWGLRFFVRDTDAVEEIDSQGQRHPRYVECLVVGAIDRPLGRS